MNVDTNRGYHDVGGMPEGPVSRGEHESALWEKRVDAILTLLIDKQRQIMRVDELRRGIESLGPEAYDRLSYYERWIASIANILVEKGVLTQDELDARVAEIDARQSDSP